MDVEKIVRCPVCARPRATEDDWDEYEDGEGEHLCWDKLDDGCVPANALALAADRDAQKARADRLAELLGLIYRWDHMDTAADGPYWRNEIAAATAKATEA
jgi:hypothetical protein